MDKPEFRSVVQFVAGRYIGLLAQVVEIKERTVRMFARDFNGDPHFFECGLDEPFRVLGGLAVLGPKPQGAQLPPKPPEPSPLAPINPADLLEPLPPNVRPQSMAVEEPSTEKTAEAAAAPWTVDEQPAELPELPSVSPRPEMLRQRAAKNKAISKRAAEILPKRWVSARVKNGLGDETIVKFQMRADRELGRWGAGAACNVATKVIANVKPFTISDWQALPDPPTNAPVA